MHTNLTLRNSVGDGNPVLLSEHCEIAPIKNAEGKIEDSCFGTNTLLMSAMNFMLRRRNREDAIQQFIYKNNILKSLPVNPGTDALTSSFTCFS